MSQFHKLVISDVRKETADCVSVAFDVPAHLSEEFKYVVGQYLTLRFDINGKDERRAYSLCSSPAKGEQHRVAVKRVEGGVVSNHINDNLKAGDAIDVMVPQGGFVLNTDTSRAGLHVGIAAGSGITPIIAMAKEVGVAEANSKFLLLYGNKTQESTIFRNELSALESDKLSVNYLLSQENGVDEFSTGRITGEKIAKLLTASPEVKSADGFYLCGPEVMINSVTDALVEGGVEKSKIHFELFTAPTADADAAPVVSDFSGTAKVTVIYDEEEVTFDLASDGENVLDVAMENDVDVPFSCKGAVCCTCKAKVTSGKMVMDANYALSEEEVAEGFVLACQAHPASPEVVVDFDEA